VVACGSALRDTGFKLVADAARADAEGIRGQFELCRKPPPLFDLGPLLAAVVIENQERFVGIKPAETSIQTLEELNVRGDGRLLCLERTIGGNRLLDVRVDLPEVFEQHEFRDDVAVVRRGGVRDCAFFFEPPRHSVQCVVGERVGVETLLALEVPDQPAPNIDVTLAA
jgi:hypothetical protein